MTRFGEISPLWLKFLKVFGNFSKALFSIWQYFELTWAKNCSRVKFHCFNWPILNNDLAIWSHWARFIIGNVFLKNGPIPASFWFIFALFHNTRTNIVQISL